MWPKKCKTNKNGQRAEKLRAGGSEVRGPVSRRVRDEGQLEGAGQGSVKGMCKGQNYQGRSNNIDQAEGISAPRGLKARVVPGLGPRRRDVA